jgi:uncharacterized protein YbjT (DUF2867 family)
LAASVSSPESTLVVGATGALGGRIVRRLAECGRAVRALVRASADAGKRRSLEVSGAELVGGDLKQPASLTEACRGVKTVISTATATVSRQEGDSIATVDELGQLDLIAAAEHAGVERFVFVSFPPRPLDYALQRAKRLVERRLAESRMSFTSLQPVSFMETWLGPAVGFDLPKGQVRILGAGDRPVSWIALDDVARAAVAAGEGGPFDRRIVPLCGPDPLTPLEVVRMFEQTFGRSVSLSYVGEDSIVASLAAAKTPLEEAYAAIMLSLARGLMPTSTDAEHLLGPLSSVRDYLARLMAHGTPG